MCPTGQGVTDGRVDGIIQYESGQWGSVGCVTVSY